MKKEGKFMSFKNLEARRWLVATMTSGGEFFWWAKMFKHGFSTHANWITYACSVTLPEQAYVCIGIALGTAQP
jgi:hypothetical protein